MLSYSSSPFTPDSLSNESSPSKPNARNNDVFQQPPCVGCVRPFSTHSAAQREAAKYIMLIRWKTKYPSYKLSNSAVSAIIY